MRAAGAHGCSEALADSNLTQQMWGLLGSSPYSDGLRIDRVQSGNTSKNNERAEQGADLGTSPSRCSSRALPLRRPSRYFRATRMSRPWQIKSDNVLMRLDFARSRAPENDRDLAALNVERGIVEQNAATIAHAQMAHADSGGRGIAVHRNGAVRPEASILPFSSL